jgi:hypothetical protein
VSRRKPGCHPSRKHYAKGLCAACYNAELKKSKKKKKHKEPVVVIHTHEVIRQVQNEEKPMAAHENDKPKAKEKEDKPVVVKSDVGETGPPQVFGGDGVTRVEDWEEAQKERREKQAEHDEKRRKQAVEDAGVIITTAKGV